MSGPRSALSRRDLFAVAAALGCAPRLDAVQAPPAVAAVAPLNRFPRMVQEFFVAQVRAAYLNRADRPDVLKPQPVPEAYVSEVRKKIAACFGPFPQRTPLNPKVTGMVERDAYVIEKVIFESRPGFHITANLYLPKGKKGPMPGVVGTCGHSVTGKAEPAYQSFCQGLARMGYVVLIFDPIGQGERLQYGHLKGKGGPGVGVGEHLLAGNQQFLVGEFLGSWRAWDGIRALDYLLTRPEVDPKRVGVTGNSGGGTMTTWLCGLDRRWAMAAPGCFVTSFRRNLENELPADTEQCPPRAIALGLDHSDFLAAMAPKPVVILAKEKDYFDPRGAEEAYRRLKGLYGQLGAEENVALHIGPTGHGYTQENREAMYRFFNRVTKASDAQAEPPLTIEKDETLRCTPTGQVADLGSRPVFAFTAERAKELGRKRGDLKGKLIQPLVGDSLKVPIAAWFENPPSPPEYRILRPLGGRKYPLPHATTYAVETEPGVFAVVYRLSETPHLSRPPKDAGRAVLYVSHHSADAELRDEPLVREVLKAEPGVAFYACDVRGIGESRPDTCGANSFLTPYGSDYFYAIHSVMLDRPYPGQKTLDLLRVIAWLHAVGHREVHLVAKGWGAIPGTFAAVLSPWVKQVTLKNALTSYSDLAQAELYRWPLSALVPGVLEKFDLPDCYAALDAKKLRQIDPVGPAG
jgi:dienelactone hydrolase